MQINRAGRARAKTLLVSGAIAGTLALAGSAAAHTTSYPSSAFLNWTPDARDNLYMQAEVQAVQAACERERRVDFFRRRAREDALVESARTNDEGIAGVTVPFREGRYYVTARRRVLASPAGHRHICAADRSVDIVVTAP